MGKGLRRPRIVFMGTPDFAVPSLTALCDAAYAVVGVVTAPDKPRGRGKQLQASPVKDCARARGIPILQPTKLRDPIFYEALRAWQPDLQVVVAFRMLPEMIWSLPPMGSINLHASLLPKYRGAAPIHWAIINGEKETGLTTFFITHAIDTGELLFQERVAIVPGETAGSLHDKLCVEGAALLLKTVEALCHGHYDRCPQPSAYAMPQAPKLFKKDCAMDWTRSAQDICQLVRGLHPTPGAFCTHQAKTYKLHEVVVGKKPKAVPLPPGVWERVDTALHIGCGHGEYVTVTSLQKEGTTRMSTHDFLRGVPVAAPRMYVVAAFDAQRAIAKAGTMLWHLPEDLKHFRRLTLGQVVIMGRRTYEALPPSYKPLPGRINIVLTRSKSLQTPSCWQADSLAHALEIARGYMGCAVFVVGGGEVYAQALATPYVERLFLTEIVANVSGDVYFPPIDANDWERVASRRHDPDDKHPYTFYFREYQRRQR